jgi:hypothetical protein
LSKLDSELAVVIEKKRVLCKRLSIEKINSKTFLEREKSCQKTLPFAGFRDVQNYLLEGKRGNRSFTLKCIEKVFAAPVFGFVCLSCRQQMVRSLKI